jgi:hypothetical protein
MIRFARRFAEHSAVTPLFFVVLAAAATHISLPDTCRASDLDDGIAIDDSIAKWDEIKVDPNLLFIVRDAKARAKIKKRDINDMMATGDASLGSVTVMPGAKTGDIINIFKGNDNTVVGGY